MINDAARKAKYHLLNTKGGPIPWPGSVATSPAVPGRRIGQTNGLDLAFPDHFAKKTLELYRNQPVVQLPLSGIFAKKPSIFLKINPQSNSQG